MSSYCLFPKVFIPSHQANGNDISDSDQILNAYRLLVSSDNTTYELS
jgi:hypothetical protein